MTSNSLAAEDVRFSRKHMPCDEFRVPLKVCRFCLELNTDPFVIAYVTVQAYPRARVPVGFRASLGRLYQTITSAKYRYTDVLPLFSSASSFLARESMSVFGFRGKPEDWSGDNLPSEKVIEPSNPQEWHEEEESQNCIKSLKVETARKDASNALEVHALTEPLGRELFF